MIIVGAGPGGATTAWKAAEAGLNVLLLDRAASLPRYKPCGGGIPASLAAHVSGFESPEGFSDLSVTHLRHSWKGKDHVHAEMTMGSGEPAEVWMVQRPHFDAWLVERAAKAGATVRSGVRASDVSVQGDSVLVSSADGESFTGKRLVGADGAKGIVGARVGLRLGKRWGIAREAEIPFENGADGNRVHPLLHSRTAYLDYGSVQNGYAWIFPKQGFLSVGAGMLLPKKPAPTEENNVGQVLRRAIDTMLHSVGMTFPESMDAPKIWGHPIPFWTGAEPLATADGRVLLVGDAAGVVQPMFGEGIQYAIRTGNIASECIVSGTTAAYTERVRELFADEFDAALRIGKIFYRTPYLSYKLGVKNPAGTKLVGRLMAGEASLHDLESRIYERLKNPLKRG